MINDNVICTEGFENCVLLNIFFFIVSSSFVESGPSSLSKNGFSNYLRGMQVNTRDEFSPVQTNENECTIISLKKNKSRVST